MPSSPRMASGCTSGTESRTTHGTSSSGWAGSSRVLPQVWRPKRACGSSMTRPSSGWLLCSFNQSAASRQYCGASRKPSAGAIRPDQPGAVASTVRSTAANTFTTCGFFSGWRHCCKPARSRPGTRTCANAWATPTIRGSRTRTSNLCRLRSAAPAPSRKERAPPESRENGSTATPSTVSPTPSMLSHTPAAGRSRRASPHRPSSATARVVRMNTGSLTRAAPATRSEERKGTQLVGPRRFSSKFIQRVVSELDSM